MNYNILHIYALIQYNQKVYKCIVYIPGSVKIIKVSEIFHKDKSKKLNEYVEYLHYELYASLVDISHV